MAGSIEPRPERSPLAIFCLHALGSSGRAWRWVDDALGATFDCVPIDLPGFGSAADNAGYDVAAMADHVVATIRSTEASRWLLAGHSMGAKVALAVARRMEDGEAGLAGLAGLVLLAGSPPSPEPMSEGKREESLAWIDADDRRVKAEAFVAQNTAEPLSPERREVAVADILRAHPAAWKAWFAHGSREDWSERVGVLDTPALILAGSDDSDLGPKAQTTLMTPHFARARAATLAGAKHLLPLERPEVVADTVRRFEGALDHPAKRI